MKLIDHMPARDYHADGAVSSSRLREAMRSMAHYKAALSTSKEPTEAMIVGSALHALVESQASFEAAFAVIPEGVDGRSKEGKAFRGLSKASTLSADKARLVYGMHSAMMTHPVVADIMRQAQHEVSAFWDDVETGLKCKARFDLYCPQIGLIADIKKTQDASLESFVSTVARYNYHLQAAHYKAAIEQDVIWAWVVVEEQPPHGVSVYTASRDMLATGENIRRRLLTEIAQCTSTGIWPGYTTKPREIDLPKWAQRE